MLRPSEQRNAAAGERREADVLAVPEPTEDRTGDEQGERRGERRGRRGERGGGRRWLVGLCVAVLIVAVAALAQALRPGPEVVTAGQWRGDGSGTTSTRAADAEQVRWSHHRLGDSSLDPFLEDRVEPLGIHGDLLLTISHGYVVAVETDTGVLRWERYLAGARPVVTGGEVLVPLGPGIATWDAATGRETGWFATGRDVPFSIVAASPQVVVLTMSGLDPGRVRAYRRDGAELFTVRGVHTHAWDTPEGPRLLLVDPRDRTAVEVSMTTGERSEPITLPSVHVATAGGWVLATDEQDTTLVWLAGRQATVLPPEQVPSGLRLTTVGQDALLVGHPGAASPGRAQVLVRVDAGSGSLTVHDDLDLGHVVTGLHGGLLSLDRQVLRLVDLGPDGASTRWQVPLDLPHELQLVDGVVGQFTPDRLLAWDTATGELSFDAVPRGLPGPELGRGRRMQPYLAADGAVLDVTGAVTVVREPEDGERREVRGVVTVAATPQGDVGYDHDSVGLRGPDGSLVWATSVSGGVRDGAVAVVGDTIAVLEQPRNEDITLRTQWLGDGTPQGVTRLPMDHWSELHRLQDAVVVVGDGVALVDLAPGGARLRWHAPVAVRDAATPIVDADALVVLDGSTATRLDLATGEVLARQRLPRAIHPVVAHDDGTIVATSGADVLALDLRTLEPRWTTSVGARITSAPTRAGDRIYVGTEQGAVVSLTARGEVAGRHETGADGPVVGAPTVAGGVLYAFTDGGRQLVALGPAQPG